MGLFSFRLCKNRWDNWDNWDTRRKAARLSETTCPVYAFVTGTQLGQVGHFGIRLYQDGAPLASIRRDPTRGKTNERD